MQSTEENPAGGLRSPTGFVDWTVQPYSDPRLSPSGLPQPAGGFHRGATRGELMSVTSDFVEDANT
jgi:hypothetical protein